MLATVSLAADKGALCLTMSALDGLSDDELAAARPALSAIVAKEGWLWLLWGIVLVPIGFAGRGPGSVRPGGDDSVGRRPQR